MNKMYVRLFWLVYFAVVLIVCTSFSLTKMGSAIFDMPESLNDQAMATCRVQGGTPILEDKGRAYKACAIAGNGIKAVVK